MVDRRFGRLRPVYIGLLLLTMVLVGLAGATLPLQRAVAGSKPVATEIRGVWLTNVDSEVLFASDRLKSAVTQLAQLNFNTLYPTVWNWGYTTYPSPVARQVTGAAVDPRPVSLEERDVLAELVQQGHQQNLVVMPWFEFGFMLPEDSAFAMRRREWLTQRRDGSQVWQEGIYPRVWLNPLRPEVQTFIQNLVLELVTRYDIDGIQFDDHFGLPNEFGYDDYTVALYRQEHQGQAPPANPSDAEWVRWRADKITDFLTRMFREIKARKHDAIVALSPNNYSFAYNHSLQDWHRWVQAGLIEELVLQVYRDSTNAFIAELQTPEVRAARQHIPTGVGVLTGLKNAPVPAQRIQQQAQLIRQQGFAGISFFFYESLWGLTSEPVNIRKSMFQSLFPAAVPHPSVPAKTWQAAAR